MRVYRRRRPNRQDRPGAIRKLPPPRLLRVSRRPIRLLIDKPLLETFTAVSPSILTRLRKIRPIAQPSLWATSTSVAKSPGLQ